MPTANIPPGADGRPDRLSCARVSSRSASLAKEKFRCLADPFERLTTYVFRAHVGMVLLGELEVGCSHRRVVCTTREAKRAQRRVAQHSVGREIYSSGLLVYGTSINTSST